MKSFDLVIIGGGIHGAACAQAAAADGFTCLTLEQYPELAEATSGRSSKLIHGGLRYLESMQLGLVHECLTEQALLLKNAPHLVRLVPFHIPIYANSTRRPWQIHCGLFLYHMLGGRRYRTIDRRDWGALDGLKTQSLQKVFQYRDAQTDDAALTRAVMHSAETLGARVLTTARFVAAERKQDGYRVKFSHLNQQQEVEACMLINAGGPWVNEVLERIRPDPPVMSVDLVAGAHVVLPGRLEHGIYYMESPSDQRAVFAQPWQGQILLGTTETPYDGKPEDVEPLPREIDYLLNIYNHYFGKGLTRKDVVASFAGLRVLPAAGGSIFHRSRETILFPDNQENPRLYSVYGGKLTAYRATGERVMKLIKPYLPKREKKADTKTLSLTA